MTETATSDYLDPAERLVRCETCRTVTRKADLLVAPSPFDPQDELTGCPNCKDVNAHNALCDRVGCRRETTAGTSTPDGYRWTCHEHRPVR